VDARASQINIVVDEEEILIRDDGWGMTQPKLDDARKVAVSAKGPESVGFRGVGLYSSYSVCDALEVVTRPSGGTAVYALRIDFATMRTENERARRGERAPLSLVDAIHDHTRIYDYPEAVPLDTGGSFTLVRLKNPGAYFRKQLENRAGVENYLRSAVPLEFAPSFPHQRLVEAGLVKYGVTPMTIAVSLKTGDGSEAALYQAHIDNLLRPVVFEITNDGRRLAVLWLCINQEPKVLKEKAAQGFQMRFNRFGIGNRFLPEQLWTGVGSGGMYYHLTGDIHALDPELKPTAERGNFEDSEARDTLYRLLKVQFAKLSQLIDRRRAALRLINDKKNGGAEVAKGIAELEAVCKEFPLDPPLKLAEALDQRGREVLARRSGTGPAETADTGNTHSPAPDDTGPEGKRNDATGGEGATGEASDPGAKPSSDTSGSSGAGDGATRAGDSAPVPSSVSEILLGLPLAWPPSASAVFAALDEAISDVVPATESEAVRAAFVQKLGRTPR
jgi:hypothetical protein